MREYEIGSEAWMRERIERGLDPAESDRPEDARLLSFELGGRRHEAPSAWGSTVSSFERRALEGVASRTP